MVSHVVQSGRHSLCSEGELSGLVLIVHWRILSGIMQLLHGPHREHPFPVSPLVSVRNLMPSIGCHLQSCYLPLGLHATISSCHGAYIQASLSENFNHRLVCVMWNS
jgi:hypothetical protein